MNRILRGTFTFASLLVLAGILVSCSSDKKDAKEKAKAPSESAKAASPESAKASWTTSPGEAGGTLEETLKATATVKAIDARTRKITLTNPDGTAAAFTAPAAMQNFDQLKVGDKVNATVISRLVIFVDRGGKPDATYGAMSVTAPKGAKPGAMVAEAFELTASIKAIDPTTRKATLTFADGSVRVVSIRPDVDLSRYKVGDTVVIRVSQQLTVVTETP